MRRIGTTLVLVSSLLVAAGPAQAKSSGPAQAKSNISHRQEMRVGAKRAHAAPQRISRLVTAGQVRGYPYGRT